MSRKDEIIRTLIIYSEVYLGHVCYNNGAPIVSWMQIPEVIFNFLSYGASEGRWNISYKHSILLWFRSWRRLIVGS